MCGGDGREGGAEDADFEGVLLGEEGEGVEGAGGVEELEAGEEDDADFCGEGRRRHGRGLRQSWT